MRTRRLQQLIPWQQSTRVMQRRPHQLINSLSPTPSIPARFSRYPFANTITDTFRKSGTGYFCTARASPPKETSYFGAIPHIEQAWIYRIQSFHMQALRRILGIRWYDKVPNAVVNERTKLPDMPSLLLTDVIHYLDTSVAYRRTHLLRRHFNCQ